MKMAIALTVASALGAGAGQLVAASLQDSKNPPGDGKLRLVGCLHRSGSTYTLDNATDITASPTTGGGSSSATGTTGTASGSPTTTTYLLLRDAQSPDLGEFVDNKVQVVGLGDARSAQGKISEGTTGSSSATSSAAGGGATTASSSSTGATAGDTSSASSSKRVTVRTVLHVSSSCS